MPQPCIEEKCDVPKVRKTNYKFRKVDPTKISRLSGNNANHALMPLDRTR